MHSWRVLLLPYLEQQNLYDRYDFSQPWNSPTNRRLEHEMPAVFAFHGDYQPGLVTTNYLAVIGEETAWPGARSRLDSEITDDPAATILVVENRDAGVHWMEPRDLHLDLMRMELDHPEGVGSKYLAPAVVMVDGSLRRLEQKLPPDVFRAMLTANGGEPIEATGETWRLLIDGRAREERSPQSGVENE